MPRPPLASLVTRWAMNAVRSGVDVAPRVIVLLAVLAERTNAATGTARPGFVVLAADTGWSADTISRAAEAAEKLGAIEVRRFKGRGRAAEFRFTEAVLKAPNLDTFAERDREKTPQACGLSLVPKTQQGSGLFSDSAAEKTPQSGGENPAGVREKPRTVAASTVSSTVSSTEQRKELALEELVDRLTGATDHGRRFRAGSAV